MTQQDTSGAVPAEYPDLARMLVEAQRAAQESLIQSGRSRAQLDQKLKDARAAAESFTRSFEPDASLLNRYSRAWAAYGARGGTQAGEAPLPSSLEQARMTWLQCEQRCERRLQGFNQRKSEYDKSQKKIFGRIKETPVLPDEFRQDLRMMGGVVEALPALRARELEARLEQARSEFTPLMQAELAVREAALSELLERSIADLSVGVELLGEQALSWPEFLSASRSAPTTLDARLRLGYFNATLPVSAVPRVPCVLEFPHRRGLAVEAGLANRADALELVRSAVLRLLLAVPAGQLQLSIFDPVAIGRSLADFLHLGDFDERLVDTRPRTSASDIEAKLAEHAAYLETIISKYLRGQFETIEEYNRQAGEMAEPYRLLVVCDFPTQFSERAIEQLLSIVENGPRCGLFTLLMYSPGAPLSRDVTYERLLASMDRVTWTGKDARLTVDGKALELDIVIDRCPVLSFDPAGKATSEAAALLAGVGAAARKAEDTSVGLDQTFQILNRMMSAGLVGRLPVLREGATAVNIRDEQTWWSGNTTSGATAPLGRAGAQSVSSLYFSSTEIAGGALMVGLPRSGKTTSLHAAILSMAMIYSPSELELFLIDAKHGVEFNAYSALPHARMVAINSEREFAVAVLESLDREIGRRAELMKHETPGRTNIEEYRKVSGQGMPRIVVVIDEFHELFEEVDQLGQAAFAAFSNIVRQGPFAGVHLVLASQTLSGMPAMDRSTLTLLPARVAFACNEDDGDIVMGDKNPEVKFLTRAGEGLLNPDRGDPLHNIRFQGGPTCPPTNATASSGTWSPRPLELAGPEHRASLTATRSRTARSFRLESSAPRRTDPTGSSSWSANLSASRPTLRSSYGATWTTTSHLSAGAMTRTGNQSQGSSAS